MLRVLAKATGNETEGDCVLLDYALRQRSRQRLVSAAGRELAVMLPRGTTLSHGDRLEAEDGTIIRVIAAFERLTRVVCRNAGELGRAAYHLGNRHVALEIGDGYVAYQQDRVLDAMLTRLGYRIESVFAPFVPEPGAYQHHQWDSPTVCCVPALAEVP